MIRSHTTQSSLKYLVGLVFKPFGNEHILKKILFTESDYFSKYFFTYVKRRHICITAHVYLINVMLSVFLHVFKLMCFPYWEENVRCMAFCCWGLLKWLSLNFCPNKNGHLHLLLAIKTLSLNHNLDETDTLTQQDRKIISLKWPSTLNIGVCTN